jgi:hypothetical protein
VKAIILLAVVLLDVFPHCGGPKVVVREPGEDCGHHGPRWRGDCHAPASCFQLEQGGTSCSTACTTDADCAPLGEGFRCTARARAYVTPDAPDVSICARN